MLCDEDLTIEREKFIKMMKSNYDETNRVFFSFIQTINNEGMNLY
jgi:hypothetical protein